MSDNNQPQTEIDDRCLRDEEEQHQRIYAALTHLAKGTWTDEDKTVLREALR